MPSYQDVLTLTSTDEVLLHRVMHDMRDQRPFGRDYPVYLSGSPIHGQGLFAAASFAAGEAICPARVAGYRTPAGRFTHHSEGPNAMMVPKGNDIALVAIQPIAAGDEITVCYLHAQAVAKFTFSQAQYAAVFDSQGRSSCS